MSKVKAKSKNKIKTHRGASKRFKVTASGKVKFNRANRRHILTKKSQKLKRQARQAGIMKKGDQNIAARLLALKS